MKNQFTWLLLGTLAVGGCGESSSDSGSESGGGAGISQGGAQDFGLFRDILDRGELPGPETLDELGFFNEHKIELPEADCGENVCVQGLLGVLGNFITGSNCTMILIGLNTPINPDDMERPPLDLALAIDTSGSMAGTPIEYVREGLSAMLDALGEDDRVTLVTYGDAAEVRVTAVEAADLSLQNEVDALVAAGSTNIYDGLRVAFESLPAETEGRERRVVLLSDGVATAGITSDARLVRLAEGYAEVGIGLTTIGVGADFDVDLMRTLSETGAGNFYFLEDPAAVREVFVEEVNTFLVPVAEDVTITVQQGTGYLLRRIHGTRLWELEEGGARIDIPSLFVAGRTSTEDNTLGRRGGGGAIIAELVPVANSADLQAGRVGEITITWTDPDDGEEHEAVTDIESTLRPGEIPEDGFFTETSVAKAFVMLNIYVGFEMATQRSADGALTDALRVLTLLRGNVADWVSVNPDDDIEDDLALIDRFMSNLNAAGASNPPQSAAPEPWPVD